MEVEQGALVLNCAVIKHVVCRENSKKIGVNEMEILFSEYSKPF